MTPGGRGDGGRGWSVQPEYHDAAGRLITASAATVAAVEEELRGRGTPSPFLALHPGDEVEGTLEVVTEDGRGLLLRGIVGPDVPFGYHTWNAAGAAAPLLVSPGRCHLPPDLHLAGWAVQVYAARSEQSWGIGDLADLRSFGAWAAPHGAGFVLINPLNAAAPAPPVEPSPYLPTSRRWRNPLYLRVEEVPGAGVAAEQLAALTAAGRALNAGATIDRDRVAALKLEALAAVAAAAPPAAEFTSWRRRQGDDLERFATYCVIAERHGADFRDWPEELRDAGGPAVARLRGGNPARVTFHAWLQWLLDRQLRDAAAALPVMTDLPIGVAPGGADVWADRQLFARGYAVGAPPDDFNSLGQDWAQPPWNPGALRERGYAPLAAVLRAGFQHAMGLRIDHVMGLFRLYWIPLGSDPTGGVYVRYPASQLLDVLALESVRARGVVVGEDLGTVEPIVREEMAARDMLSYRLVYFSEVGPGEFPRRALSAVTTHDLPTIAGLWTGADARECAAIGVPVNEAGLDEVRARLERVTGRQEDAADVAVAAYRALAASPSMLVTAALEDAAGASRRPNVPGTTSVLRPNWSLPLPAPLDGVLGSPLPGRVAKALRRDAEAAGAD